MTRIEKRLTILEHYLLTCPPSSPVPPRKKRSRTPPPPENAFVFITSPDPTVMYADYVYKALDKYGTIVDVYIWQVRETGAIVGRVEFKHEKDANYCLDSKQQIQEKSKIRCLPYKGGFKK